MYEENNLGYIQTGTKQRPKACCSQYDDKPSYYPDSHPCPSGQYRCSELDWKPPKSIIIGKKPNLPNVLPKQKIPNMALPRGVQLHGCAVDDALYGLGAVCYSPLQMAANYPTSIGIKILSDTQVPGGQVSAAKMDSLYNGNTAHSVQTPDGKNWNITKTETFSPILGAMQSSYQFCETEGGNTTTSTGGCPCDCDEVTATEQWYMAKTCQNPPCYPVAVNTKVVECKPVTQKSEYEIPCEEAQAIAARLNSGINGLSGCGCGCGNMQGLGSAGTDTPKDGTDTAQEYPYAGQMSAVCKPADHNWWLYLLLGAAGLYLGEYIYSGKSKKRKR